MQRKAQAALEFLSTYGFAFLIILVMIGALSYFGVLNPKTLIPNRCTMSAEFQCFETQFQRNVPGVDQIQLNVVVINQLGNTITFLTGGATSQYGNSNACGFVPNSLSSGARATISCPWPAAPGAYPSTGEKVKASLSFNYTELGKTFPVTVNAEVLQTLQ